MVFASAHSPYISAQFQRNSIRSTRGLHTILFLLILSSFFTFVQPSPYEILIVPLLIACVAAGVKIDIKVLPLIILLVILEIAGFISLTPVFADADAFKFMVISTYLALTGAIFAFIFSTDIMRRLSILRSAYVLSACIAAILGIGGYFNLVPNADLFVMNDRAVSTFKDPNIFGPFLILPLLLLIERFLAGVIKFHYILASGIILVGLLLAFSRAAWGHFAISIALMLAILFVTSHDRKFRMRVIFFTVTAGIAAAILFAGLLTIEDVRVMFEQRFRLLQEYDVGTSGSRFNIQSLSIQEILAHPNGMGPWIFAKKYDLVSHNSYLGITLNHGWLGGAAYLALVLSTLFVGFRALLVRTPWQPILAAIYATYFGLALESLVVDTDHWRHYYLLLGLIWGIFAATVNYKERSGEVLHRTPQTILPRPLPGRANAPKRFSLNLVHARNCRSKYAFAAPQT